MPALTDIFDQLAQMPEDERSENLYRLDEEEGRIRRANFLCYLEDMYDRQTRDLMLLEAPGYRGCAKTGIPITSERIMLAGVDAFNLFGEPYQQTSEHPEGVAEASATILWGALVEHVKQPPLLWNTFVLHPHKRSNTESNRKPTRTEQRTGHTYIAQMMDLFAIQRVFAVGRVAQRNLDEMGIDHIPLRHPSQGGKAEFIQGLVTAVTG